MMAGVLLLAGGAPVLADATSEGTGAPWVSPLIRGSVPADGPRRLLREQVADAAFIVAGVVSELRSHDGGALQVAHVDVTQWWRGDVLAEQIRIVDIRGALRRRILPEAGTRVVAVLDRAAAQSYLREHLPGGHYYAPAGGSTQAMHPDLDESGAAALAAWLAHGNGPPSAQTRKVAFRLMRIGRPALAQQGVGELARVSPPQTLSDEEWATVEQVMVASLPGKGELALQLAAWAPEGALEALELRPADDPVTRSHVMQARLLLGADYPLDALLEKSRDRDPAQRAGVLPVMALLSDEAALARIGRLAVNDPHPGVRRVAVAALAVRAGRLDPAPALNWLEDAFDSEHPEIRSAAIQALTAHGDNIEERLIRLVRTSDHSEAREYAAGVLVLRVGPDDPRVRALHEQTETPGLRRVLEEGIFDPSGIHDHGADYDGHGHGHEH